MSKKVWGALLIAVVIVVSSVAYWYLQKDGAVEKRVKEGDKIQVEYIGRLNTSAVFDTSRKEVAKNNRTYPKAWMFKWREKYSPLEFTVGTGQMIQGFDEAVIGMSVGESKKIIIPPWKAYGNWSWNNVTNISLTENVPQYENLTEKEFWKISGGETAKEGIVFQHQVWKWKSKVCLVYEEGNDTYVTIKNLCNHNENESNVSLSINSTKYVWNSTVTNITPLNITLRHEAVVEMVVDKKGKKGRVEKVDERNGIISIDFNGLRGETLIFEIELIEIE